MNAWAETSIALVYYSGLVIALIIGIGAIAYLRAGAPIAKIIGEPSSLWRYSFRSTLITAGLLGALTVSFKGCDCDYRCLVGNPEATINLGIHQVRQAFITLAAVATGWFVVLIIVQLFVQRVKLKSVFGYTLLLGTIAIPLAIMWLCFTFELF